jgi:heme-degrading monooxygenase HmoA
MLTLRPPDERVPIQHQLGATATPVVLINVFTVDPTDVGALLAAWEHDANWMKRQPGYISTQLHRSIGGSCVFLNYALWESVEPLARASTHPEFVSALAR